MKISTTAKVCFGLGLAAVVATSCFPVHSFDEDATEYAVQFLFT